MTQPQSLNITVKIISLQYEKPYVSITEEHAVIIEALSGKVKRVSSERFGDSVQVALKIAPPFMTMPNAIPRTELKVGFSYVVDIKPYKFLYQGKTGVSLQSNFIEELPKN